MKKQLIKPIAIGAMSLGFLLVLSPVIAQESLDPCPKVMDAARQTPGDLSAVQSDIERYTLCVQRAVLLQRLNEMAAENEEDVSPSLTLDSIEGLPYSRAEIEEMVQNLKSREEEVSNLMAEEAETTDEATQSDQDVTETNYFISEVFGAGGDMEVNLLDQDQTPYRVKVGSELPDGSTVISVSAQAVTLVKDGKQKKLDWAPKTSGGS